MDEPTWIPRPDPALRVPLPDGIRPHRHEPGLLHDWVFLQHQVWVDYWGNEHEIESMPLDYVANVIAFCERRAPLIRTIAFAEAAERALCEADNEAELSELICTDLHSFATGDDPECDGSSLTREDSLRWLHGTALLSALTRRASRERS